MSLSFLWLPKGATQTLSFKSKTHSFLKLVSMQLNCNWYCIGDNPTLYCWRSSLTLSWCAVEGKGNPQIEHASVYLQPRLFLCVCVKMGLGAIPISVPQTAVQQLKPVIQTEAELCLVVVQLSQCLCCLKQHTSVTYKP